MMRSRFAALLLYLGAAMLLILPGLACAAEPDSATPRAGSIDAPPPLSPPPPPPGVSGDTFRLPAPPPLPESMPGSVDDSAYPIEEVVFTGNRAIDTDALQTLSLSILHHRASATELGLFAQRVSLYYFERGYVNSGVSEVELNASSSTLTVHIIEGHLTTVRIEGSGGLDSRYIVMRLRASDDEVLNADVLRERFQILLTDPLFESARAQLQAGLSPGESILDVSIDRALPYDLTLFANNYRPVSTGSSAFGVSGTVRDMTGWGDTLNASIQSEIFGATGLSGALDWHVPFDGWGGEVYFAIDTSNDSVIQQSLAPLDIESRLNDATLGLRHYLLLSLAQKMTLGFEAIRRESRTWLLDVPFSFTPGTSNGRIVDDGFRIYDEYGLRTEDQSLTTRITFTDARNDLVNEGGVLANTARIPNDQHSLLLQGQYGHLVGSQGDQLIARLTVQRTDQSLDPLNQIAIGGVLTVRGFLENELVRDNGTAFNLEYQHAINLGDVHTTLSPFFDWGNARNEGQGATDISSVGLASSLAWKHWRLDIALAHRLIHPTVATPTGGSLQAAGVELQLAYTPLR
jgi:hemolysin activation/secretion protein